MGSLCLILLLSACSQSNPGGDNGDKIVGVVGLASGFAVFRQSEDGNLRACLYESQRTRRMSGPLDMSAAGCVDVPAQR
jgi:hypothetical protein